jgi:hypothetical protein
VKLRAKTMDLIVAEYADAVAAGEFERAEGWFAVAQFASARSAASSPLLERVLDLRQRSVA